jgi:hypothetical protein
MSAVLEAQRLWAWGNQDRGVRVLCAILCTSPRFGHESKPQRMTTDSTIDTSADPRDRAQVIWPNHGHITWGDSDEAIDVFTAMTAEAPPGEQS